MNQSDRAPESQPDKEDAQHSSTGDADSGNARLSQSERVRLETELKRAQQQLHAVRQEQERTIAHLRNENAHLKSQNQQHRAVLDALNEDASAPSEQTIRALRQAKEYAESIVQTIPDALLVLDGELCVQTANNAFYQIFSMNRQDVQGHSIYELDKGQWNIPALRHLLEEILPKNNFITGYEVEHEFERQGRRTLLINARQLEIDALRLLAITDITARKDTERALRESEKRFTAFLEQLPVGVGMFNKQRQWVIKNPLLHELVGNEIPSFGEGAQSRWQSWDSDGKILEVSQWPGPRALRGETVTPGMQFLYTKEDGSKIWVRVSTTPFRNEKGELTGVITVVDDITERKQAALQVRANEARQRFLLQLGDTMRNRTDAREILAIAAEWLGRHLKVDRAGYAEIDESGELSTVRSDWSAREMPDLGRRQRLDKFGPAVIPELGSGRTIRIDDVLTHPYTADTPAAFAELQVRAIIGVPLIKGGRLVALFYVYQSQPRHWSDEDETLVREVAERTWAAVQRARAEEALRKSESSYRTLFESIDEGFCVFEMLYNDKEEPVDYRWLEINPAFERHTGLKNAIGKTARELVPNLEQHWVDIYGRIARTGQREQFVNQSEAMGRWFEVDGFRTGEPEERKVALLFNDITERKQSEEALRQLNESLEEQVEERTRQVRELVTQLTMSEQAERHRISQMLHDDLQQQLYGLQFQITFLRDALSDSPTHENRDEVLTSLEELDEGLVQAIQNTRSLSVELSPLVLAGEGLAEAVGWLAAQMKRQHGLSVHVQATDDVPVPNVELRVLLFQIVRELLFNTVKHAQVLEAVVSLSRVDEHIQIEVTDRGVGFDINAFMSETVMTHGLIQSLRRLELVGGHMEVESAPNSGTHILLTCPITSESA